MKLKLKPLPLICAILFPPGSGRLPAAARPNMVLIVCDDLNAYIGDLGGHPRAQPPNLSQRPAFADVRAEMSARLKSATQQHSFAEGILEFQSFNLK